MVRMWPIYYFFSKLSLKMGPAAYSPERPFIQKMWYKQTLQSLDIDPPTCSCSLFPFNYSPAGHIITGDVDIVKNDDLKSLVRKAPKFREPRSFYWRQNFVSIMNTVEDYS
jgi:hypothetical protein